jgi:hypothetical protein
VCSVLLDGHYNFCLVEHKFARDPIWSSGDKVYMDPRLRECIAQHDRVHKHYGSDMFGFGVIVYEMLCGEKLSYSDRDIRLGREGERFQAFKAKHAGLFGKGG